MKTINLIMTVILVLMFHSCKKESDSPKTNKDIKISGSVQKGPFMNGTNISIFELNSILYQTGKVYSTQIDDNKGSFKINIADLSSQYVELHANGYYYNEVTGDNSSAPLTLSALTDLSDSLRININILSTLEKKRVEYLIASGKTFKESKIQAENEILKIFSIKNTGMSSPEYLDITKKGDSNAILLAISVILQGYRSEADLSELIADLSEDISTDGKIDNASIGSDLINHARILINSKIRQNLEKKYSSLNEEVIIPDFEKYIEQFIDSTGYSFTDVIQYPELGNSGPNLLSYNQFDYSEQVVPDDVTFEYFKLSLAAHVPKSVDVQVVIIFHGGKILGLYPVSNSGWAYDDMNQSGVLVLTKDFTREDLDMKMNLQGTGSATIEVYENKISKPVRVKEIYW